MKKPAILLILALWSTLPVFSQDLNTGASKVAIDSLNKRISDLQVSIKEQQESQRRAEAQSQQNNDQTYRDQFRNAVQALQTGLEMGSEIEQIVPGTLRLLATKDLNETLNAINNPTSNSVGTSFSDMVIESASRHLLPQFPDEILKVQARSKFKSVLESIYKGPLMQSLLNTNPITSTVNFAIQQAGFYEKPRDPIYELSKRQIKDVSDKSPIKIQLNTANYEGSSFNSEDMDAFNKDLAKRIEFYTRLNQYSTDQNEVTQQLYIEARLIKKSVRASKTEICKLLGIDPENASVGFNQKFENLTIDQIKTYLREANFRRALSLSDYATERLPEVKDFNNTVVGALIDYIDGYIKILNDFKNVPEAKLSSIEIAKQVLKLENIKRDLQVPLKS